MEATITARSITKSFGPREVLTELNLKIPRGEMLAIVGSSGSGKSTLLNIFGLLEKPDTGNLHLFGAPAPLPNSIGASRLLRSRIGYLFQNYALIDNATVSQNLRVAQVHSGLTKREQALARQGALSQMGLSGLDAQKVYSLSGGEQQRVAVARLFLKPCDLVLADEPTGSLDANNRDLVMQGIRSLNSAGKTVVIVTHDRAVSAACDRVVSLDDRTT